MQVENVNDQDRFPNWSILIYLFIWSHRYNKDGLLVECDNGGDSSFLFFILLKSIVGGVNYIPFFNGSDFVF